MKIKILDARDGYPEIGPPHYNYQAYYKSACQQSVVHVLTYTDVYPLT